MPCIRICKIGSNNGDDKNLILIRKRWNLWDLRALVMYILFTQLFLHIFGRLRKKSTTGLMITANVWLLYLLSDLVATIALGKLSKVRGDQDDTSPISLLRGLWAPIILFFLGGPDSMTILRLEENEMWLKHFVGLLTLGLRASYIMSITWANPHWFFVLTLLMLVPGLIKYGERVWVMKSRASKKYEGFVQLDQSTIHKISVARAQRPNVGLVLQAYSYFHILKPHIPDYECDTTKLHQLADEFHKWVVEGGTIHNTFKLIEIELGLMYDMLFSKVGTIFTVLGSILRFISFSCIILVLVGIFNRRKPLGKFDLDGDLPITVILLVGALVLEIAGVLVQFGSDWAIVWACKHYPSKLVVPIFYVHELMISKSKRWSELMGQFSLVNFYNKKKSKIFNKIVEVLCGRENMWERFSLPLSPIQPSLKELIINQLCEKPKHISQVGTSEASTLKISEWTLGRYGYLDEFKWIIELEFDESIVIWHVATDICYHLETEGSTLVTDEVEATKILSYYMMYLLLICSSSLPFCNNNEKFMQVYTNVKKVFEGQEFESSEVEPHKLLLQKEWDSNNMTIHNIQKLVRGLMEKENKWKIMSNVWVEMLCYAANRCPVKNHVQELRRGGQFITHVWLLLLHLGVAKRSENIKSEKSIDKDAMVKNVVGKIFDYENEITNQ